MSKHADPDQVLPPPPEPLPRRHLLRHTALLAGAAGVAAATLSSPEIASAADGDGLTLGEDNTASTTTSLGLRVPTGGPDPTLALANANGPTLSLQALDADFSSQLELGQLANTELGPIIGVDSELGLTTTFLATGVDLADLPTPYPLPAPTRLLDTRTAAGRRRVIASSTNPWDAAYRLKAGAWIDVEAAVVTGEFEATGIWANLTAVTPAAGGYLTLYPPGAFPGTSSLSFQKNVTLANGAFVATGIVAGRFAVRIRTTAVTHVILDLTGISIRGSAPTPAGVASAQRSSKATRATITRRLRSTLAERARASLTR